MDSELQRPDLIKRKHIVVIITADIRIKDVRIAFEASGSSYSVDRNLRNLGYSDITVAHPKELSWIIKSKKKNNHVYRLSQFETKCKKN